MTQQSKKDCKVLSCPGRNNCEEMGHLDISPPSPAEGWEKEFDKEYGSDMDSWMIGIVSEALHHGKYEDLNKDASYITVKLKKLISSIEHQSYQKGRESVIENIKDIHITEIRSVNDVRQYNPSLRNRMPLFPENNQYVKGFNTSLQIIHKKLSDSSESK